MSQLAPQVSFRVYRDGQVQYVLGYLVRQPDGQVWAFPDEQTHAEDPLIAGAVQLDPKYLEQQPMPPDERPLYFYRVVVGAPPQ